MTPQRTSLNGWMVFLGLCVSVRGFGGSMTYTVVLNPNVCREAQVGRFTVPIEAFAMDYVSTGKCHPEIRSADEEQLYVTATCAAPRGTWISAPQKYAVNLSSRKSARSISETEWQSAPELAWSENGFYPPRPEDHGVQYKGPVLERSGPRWTGVGGSGPLRTLLSRSGNRAAVNSWDGFAITRSFLDPTSFGKRDKVEGQFWVDIYETSSGQSLIRIRGSFHGANPYIFQSQAAWYSDRFYVLPVGGTSSNGEFNLRRLLICDADAASRKSDGTLKERGNGR